MFYVYNLKADGIYVCSQYTLGANGFTKPTRQYERDFEGLMANPIRAEAYVKAAKADTPVTEAQALMKREKIHHLPVLDRDGKLAGIVTEDVPLEEAARLMADRNIGGLPVVRGSTLVGIITESDLFRVFIELFGARQKGVRVSLVLPNERGELAKVSSALTKAGGNIIALGTFLAEDTTQGRLTVKVEGLSREKIAEVLRPLAVRIEDIRDT